MLIHQCIKPLSSFAVVAFPPLIIITLNISRELRSNSGSTFLMILCILLWDVRLLFLQRWSVILRLKCITATICKLSPVGDQLMKRWSHEHTWVPIAMCLKQSGRRWHGKKKTFAFFWFALLFFYVFFPEHFNESVNKSGKNWKLLVLGTNWNFIPTSVHPSIEFQPMNIHLIYKSSDTS